MEAPPHPGSLHYTSKDMNEEGRETCMKSNEHATIKYIWKTKYSVKGDEDNIAIGKKIHEQKPREQVSSNI